MLLDFRCLSVKKENTDGISVNSSVDSSQVLDNDDTVKGDGTEESRAKSMKTDSRHIEVRDTVSNALKFRLHHSLLPGPTYLRNSVTPPFHRNTPIPEIDEVHDAWPLNCTIYLVAQSESPLGGSLMS